MEISRRLLEVIIFLSLLVAYAALAYCNNPNAELLGDLLKLVTVAIVSYEFGRVTPTLAHLEPEYVRRAAALCLGFGIALIVEHFVVHGGFDPIWEDPLGHEYIGLYLIVVSMLLLRK